MNKKSEKILYITRAGELLFWLIIILILSIMFFCFRINHKHSAGQYNIFMPDVDGLIVGSPVRMMGIEVGHITKIKPLKREVFVKFVLTDKNVYIPQGTKATVEFSGMAGSKSLELYLPDKNSYIDSTVPLLEVNPPKRLNDALSLLNEMFKKIGDIIYTSSDFGTKIQEINFPEKSGSDSNSADFIKFSNSVLDDAIDRAENFGKVLKNAKQK